MAVEVTSIEVMHDTDAPHETDDPTPSAAGGVGDGLESEAKGEDLGNEDPHPYYFEVKSQFY